MGWQQQSAALGCGGGGWPTDIGTHGFAQTHGGNWMQPRGGLLPPLDNRPGSAAGWSAPSASHGFMQPAVYAQPSYGQQFASPGFHQPAVPSMGMPQTSYGWGSPSPAPVFDPQSPQYGFGSSWQSGPASPISPGYSPWTQQQHQQQMDPVVGFMHELGMEDSEQADLGFIAEYGLAEGVLPGNWSTHLDNSSGQYYYVSADGQQTQWENPLLETLRQVVEIGRLYLEMPAEGYFSEQKSLIWGHHVEDLEVWHGPYDTKEGRSYFLNSSTGESSFEDPRADTQFIYEVESNLLDSLEERLPTPRTLRMQKAEAAAQREPEPDLPGFGVPENKAANPVSPDSGGSGTSPRFGETTTPRKGDRIREMVGDSLADRTSALKRLGAIADKHHAVCCDEVEAQLLQLSNKAKLRKMRRKKIAAGKEAYELIGSSLPRFSGPLKCRETQEKASPP